MLQINKSRLAEQQSLPVAEFVSPAELYASVVGFLRRQYSVIAFVSLLTLLLGAVYIFTSAPRYSARAILVIDSHKPQFLQSEAQLAAAPMDSSAVDTQNNFARVSICCSACSNNFASLGRSSISRI